MKVEIIQEILTIVIAITRFVKQPLNVVFQGKEIPRFVNLYFKGQV